MGTRIQMVAYTSASNDEAAVRRAMQSAYAEMRQLEQRMSEWRADSELSEINRRAGAPIRVSPDTFEVISKSLWASKISEGTFDISFAKLGELWKFGDAAEKEPRVPSKGEIAARQKLVDYRRIRLDSAASTVTIAPGSKLGLGGIAKGYIVDCAARALRRAKLDSFLVQAGGDLYGAGKKPDGAPWVSGIQDPRGKQGQFFATIELTDRAFSTAGDYARVFFKDGKRYHHIIDPRTGYPATLSRSVTIWAPDATTADAIDDGVFILGPEKGLALVESLEGVGAVIVDERNKVWISKRLQGRVRALRAPTDGP
jgi:thiamine biosynthesis lipoprotein